MLKFAVSSRYVFQHTHQPEGRCDKSSRPIPTGSTRFNTRTSPKAGATFAGGFTVYLQGGFQHTHQPEGRCDSFDCPQSCRPRSFNTRTSPKAGATTRPWARLARFMVSTHAPARRPVRPAVSAVLAIWSAFQHTHQPEGRCDRPPTRHCCHTPCFNTRTSPKAGATNVEVRGVVQVRVSTHAPARRPVRHAASVTAPVLPLFQHTHQPEGRCDLTAS